MKSISFENQYWENLKLINENTSDWKLLHITGYYARMAKKHNEAVSLLIAASQFEPKEADVYRDLGQSLYMVGRFEESCQTYNKSLELDPGFVTVYDMLADSHIAMGEREFARQDYERGLEALSIHLVKLMDNSDDNTIHDPPSHGRSLWFKYACHGARYLTAGDESIKSIEWLKEGQLTREMDTQSNKGKYWLHKKNGKYNTIRVFLPNYFSTFACWLHHESSYSLLNIRLCGVLEKLGSNDQAGGFD